MSCAASPRTPVPASRSVPSPAPPQSVSDRPEHTVTMPPVPNGQLSPISYVVLGLVAAGATTPYDMKQTAARSVGYFWNFPHSQLYAEPSRLAGLGLLSEERETRGRRRRVYTLAPEGRKALDEWLREPTNEQPQIR